MIYTIDVTEDFVQLFITHHEVFHFERDGVYEMGFADERYRYGYFVAYQRKIDNKEFSIQWHYNGAETTEFDRYAQKKMYTAFSLLIQDIYCL